MAWAVRLSVCLSSVTLLRHTQKMELFGNIFAPSDSLWTHTLCIKILTKKPRRGSRRSCKLLTIAVVYDLSIGAIFNDIQRLRNPRFKVMPIFDAEYNHYRYTMDAYWGLQCVTTYVVRFYTRPTHRCNFEWLWTTLSDLQNFSS